jgi:drug/metabolite transporter (DMT)-like permease
MAERTLRISPTDWLWIVVLSILWGGSFIFIEVALAGFAPLTLVTLRVGLAALVLAAGLVLTRRLPAASWRLAGMFLVLGLVNNALPFTLFAWGQTHIGAGLASIFNATTPLFTILIAHFATRDEKITVLRLAAVLIGFVGVVVLLGGDMDGGTNLVWAGLACLGASISYAVAGVYGRTVAARVTPAQASMGQLAASFILMAPLALVVERPWTMPAPALSAVAALVGLALASTALAYIIFFHVLERAGATNVLLVTFLQPVSAVAMGVVLLDEMLSATEAAGMVLILVGLLVADGRLVARRRRSRLTP